MALGVSGTNLGCGTFWTVGKHAWHLASHHPSLFLSPHRTAHFCSNLSSSNVALKSAEDKTEEAREWEYAALQHCSRLVQVSVPCCCRECGVGCRRLFNYGVFLRVVLIDFSLPLLCNYAWSYICTCSNRSCVIFALALLSQCACKLGNESSPSLLPTLSQCPCDLCYHEKFYF